MMNSIRIVISGTMSVFAAACVSTASTPAPTTTPMPVATPFMIKESDFVSINSSPSISPSPTASPSPTPVGKPKPSGSFEVTDATAPVIKDLDGIKNQFRYVLNNRGRQVLLGFNLGVYTAHLPWKKVRICWGRFFTEVETVLLNDGTVSTDGGFAHSFNYPSQQYVMTRTLCVELTDSWDVKRVVCGKFGPDYDSMRVKFCSDFALDNIASPSALIESVFNQCQTQ